MRSNAWVFLTLCVALFACEADVGDAGGGGLTALAPPSTTYTTVLDSLGFTRAEDGVAPGFNIDGRVSKDGEEASCEKGDFVSPWGTPGVDNQFAKLVPLIELSGIGALEGLVAAVIKDGGLLVVVEVKGVDDRVNDDAVELTIRLGSGVPLLGTDGLVLAGQTFALHPDSPESSVPAKIIDGVLQTEVFDTTLPIVVFGVGYQLALNRAQVRAVVTEDGGLVEGVLGGGIPVESILEIAKKAENGQKGLEDLISGLIGTAGDMKRDPSTGQCMEVSAALSFTAVSAFLDEGRDSGSASAP